MTSPSEIQRCNRLVIRSVTKERIQVVIEAVLFGQFMALQESGLKQLGSGNRQGVPSEQARNFLLATKLLNTANQTMQTLIKYRSCNQQTVQVIHMHNEGQAIVAQNISPPRGK